MLLCCKVIIHYKLLISAHLRAQINNVHHFTMAEINTNWINRQLIESISLLFSPCQHFEFLCSYLIFMFNVNEFQTYFIHSAMFEPSYDVYTNWFITKLNWRQIAIPLYGVSKKSEIYICLMLQNITISYKSALWICIIGV